MENETTHNQPEKRIEPYVEAVVSALRNARQGSEEALAAQGQPGVPLGPGLACRAYA